MYRAANNMPDLFGQPTWSLGNGTVASTIVEGKLYFGTNSSAPVYQYSDETAALMLRRELMTAYPKVMDSVNAGQMPNDAVFHAETTVLLRAAKDNGGSLAGKSLEIYVDRPMCFSCYSILPLVGLQLGNPTVTFTGPALVPKTMRNGEWIR
jgi:hypothetical protein